MSVLGTKTNLHDRARFVVDIRLVRGRSTGGVRFTQTVPGRPYRTPRERLPLRPREAAEFELRFSGQAVAAAFDVALEGAPGEPFAVHFLFAHRSERAGDREEPIDEAQFELAGALSTADYTQTVELAYDGTTARWRTSDPSPPVRRVKRPAPLDLAAMARRGVREESDPTRERSLHEAAEEADAATVRSLLERGADVHARNFLLEMPLHVAVRSRIFVWMHTPRQLDVVEQLLDAGADLDARDLVGATPLHRALEDLHGMGSANLDVVKLLLLRGADPDARSDGGFLPTDKPSYVSGHLSPGDLMQQFARRSALLEHVIEMLDAARRGTLA